MFVENSRDILGLQLASPERVVMLSADGNSRFRARDRTQPVLLVGREVPERLTHDCKRNGVTSLFAALDDATVEVIGMCESPRRRLLPA